MFEPGHPVEKALLVANLALLLLLPWVFGGNRDWLWAWFAAAGFLLAAITAACCAVDSRRHGLLFRQAWPLFLLWGLAWLASALPVLLPATLAVADRDAALRGLILHAFFAVTTVQIVLLTHSRRRLRYVLLAVFAMIAAQAMFGLVTSLSAIDWQLFGLKPMSNRVAHGSYINRNHFAGLLAMGGLLGFGLLCADLEPSRRPEDWRQRLRRWAGLLLSRKLLVRTGLIVVVLALVVSQSRMGNLAFAIALCVCALLALLCWRPRPPALLPVVISIFVLDLIVAGSWFGLDRLRDRFAETTVVASVQAVPEASPVAGSTGRVGGVDPSDAERARVAFASLKLLEGHWGFGIGLNGFRVAFPNVKPDGVRLYYEHAHNDWVQMLVERGVIGFALWLAGLIYAFGLLLRTLWRREDRLFRGAALGLFGALLALSIHGLADFNLQIAANAWLFHVLAALSVNVAALPARQQPSSP